MLSCQQKVVISDSAVMLDAVALAPTLLELLGLMTLACAWSLLCPFLLHRHIGPASRLKWADPEALLHAQRAASQQARDAAASALLAALRLQLAQQTPLELIREKEEGRESSDDEESSNWQAQETDTDSRSSVSTHVQLAQAEEMLTCELESHSPHGDDPLKAQALIIRAITAAAGISLGTAGTQHPTAAAAAAAPSLGRAWAVYVLVAWCGVDAPAHVIDAVTDAVNIVLAEITSQVGMVMSCMIRIHLKNCVATLQQHDPACLRC